MNVNWIAMPRVESMRAGVCTLVVSLFLNPFAVSAAIAEEGKAAETQAEVASEEETGELTPEVERGDIEDALSEEEARELRELMEKLHAMSPQERVDLYLSLEDHYSKIEEAIQNGDFTEQVPGYVDLVLSGLVVSAGSYVTSLVPSGLAGLLRNEHVKSAFKGMGRGIRKIGHGGAIVAVGGTVIGLGRYRMSKTDVTRLTRHRENIENMMVLLPSYMGDEELQILEDREKSSTQDHPKEQESEQENADELSEEIDEPSDLESQESQIESSATPEKQGPSPKGGSGDFEASVLKI